MAFNNTSYDQNIGRPGVVYILNNPGLRDGYLKIGCSRYSGKKRADDLNLKANTGTPGTFKCVYEKKTQDCGKAEQEVFKILSKYRRGKKHQEFFEVSEELAKKVIDKACNDIDGIQLIKTTNSINELQNKDKPLLSEDLKSSIIGFIFIAIIIWGFSNIKSCSNSESTGAPAAEAVARATTQAERDELVRLCSADDLERMESTVNHAKNFVNFNSSIEELKISLDEVFGSAGVIRPAKDNIKEKVLIYNVSTKCDSNFYFLVNFRFNEAKEILWVKTWAHNTPQGYQEGLHEELSYDIDEDRKAYLENKYKQEQIQQESQEASRCNVTIDKAKDLSLIFDVFNFPNIANLATSSKIVNRRLLDSGAGLFNLDFLNNNNFAISQIKIGIAKSGSNCSSNLYDYSDLYVCGSINDNIKPYSQGALSCVIHRISGSYCIVGIRPVFDVNAKNSLNAMRQMGLCN